MSVTAKRKMCKMYTKRCAKVYSLEWEHESISEKQSEFDFKPDRPSTPHSSPKHPASDCVNVPFLKPSVSQRARPPWLSRAVQHALPLFALQKRRRRSCPDVVWPAVCSVPASAAPLHPSLLRNEERARLGGRSVPLPVSPFTPAPPAWRRGRRCS